MQFDSINSLLKWFANREYLRPPRPFGNHEQVILGGRRLPMDGEEVWRTYLRIERIILETLTARDYVIVIECFRNIERREIARKVRCTPRNVYMRRRRAIKTLNGVMISEGLVSIGRRERIRYLGVDDEEEIGNLEADNGLSGQK